MGESTVTTGFGEEMRVLVERMAEAATDWLASLSADQRSKAQFTFPDEEERTLWYYTPTERGGVPLEEMDPIQQRLAHRFIASGLSGPGYNAVATIMGLENILDAREGWKATYPGRPLPSRGRNPLLYYVSVFGDPSTGTWGWRVGGHHVCLNYTIVGGVIAAPTPLFFGSNPAECRFVGPGLLRPLAGEEDLGRELLFSLDNEQLGTAMLAPVAPTDIVQSNRPRVEAGALPKSTSQLFGKTVPDESVQTFMGVDRFHRDRNGPNRMTPDDYQEVLRYTPHPKGLAAAAMKPNQREILVAVIRQYVDRLPEQLAAIHRRRLTEEDFDAMHFAWAGGREHLQPHYYRIQGPRLLIEYDNTQNDANHIHAVWRDPEGDFGVDLLAEHYRTAH